MAIVAAEPNIAKISAQVAFSWVLYHPIFNMICNAVLSGLIRYWQLLLSSSQAHLCPVYRYVCIDVFMYVSTTNLGRCRCSSSSRYICSPKDSDAEHGEGIAWCCWIVFWRSSLQDSIILKFAKTSFFCFPILFSTQLVISWLQESPSLLILAII